MGVLSDGYAKLAEDLGLETSLKDVGIKETDLELLATEAMKVTRLLQNNMRELEWQDAYNLYNQAFNA